MAGWREGDVPPDHPLFGKRMVLEMLGMPGTHYSFDHEGWHFVVLDNIHLTEPGKYTGAFSDEQLAFLRADLEAQPEAPTVVVVHLPALTVAPTAGGRAEPGEDAWRVGYARVSPNPMDLVEVMRLGNVRAVLQNHVHHVERIDTLGLTFITDGAVSADKWDGPMRGGYSTGFGVYDCYADGSFEHRYHEFDWSF